MNNEKRINEAKNHEQTHIFGDNKDHTNVLLLALSTFGHLKESEFKYKTDGDSISVRGRYQLEPIPKMLDELLARKGETLDKIIMLCTEDTRVEKQITTPEGKKTTISPEEYFKNQVKNYMNPAFSDDEKFVSIPISPDSPYQGIQKVIETLRSPSLPDPRLYLDAHGGFRGIQRILEATVSLLKIENIQIEEVFGIEYSGPDQKKEPNRIILETERVKLFDFVSGINEFISCGRADTLLNYVSSIDAKNEADSLIRAIKRVADGIQWCCIPEFEAGLDDLQIAMTSKSASNAPSYLNLYRTNISQDYGALIGKRTVVDEIEWCLRKGFYQQALTLIESKISTLLIDDWRLFEINKEYTVTGKPSEHKYVFVDSKGNKQTVHINDIFNALVFLMQKKILTNNKNEDPILSKSVFNSLSDGDYELFLDSISIKELEKVEDHTLKHFLTNALKMTTLPAKGSGHVPAPDCLTITDKANTRVLFQLLILHKALKVVRNNMNHASDKFTYQLGAIKRALEFYMKWLNELKPRECQIK